MFKYQICYEVGESKYPICYDKCPISYNSAERDISQFGVTIDKEGKMGERINYIENGDYYFLKYRFLKIYF